MIFCCLSVGCLPAVYLTCTFTKHLVPPPYLTLYFISAKWGRKELNLQCLPRGNGFTVRRNTANRCRFPITAIRRLAIIFIVPCSALHIRHFWHPMKHVSSGILLVARASVILYTPILCLQGLCRILYVFTDNSKT